MNNDWLFDTESGLREYSGALEELVEELQEDVLRLTTRVEALEAERTVRRMTEKLESVTP